MATKTISTEQNAQRIDATTFLQVSSAACKVYNIEGNCTAGGADPCYLAAYARSPQAGDTALWCQKIMEGTGFSFTYNEVGIDSSNLTALANNSALWFALTKTDSTFTAVTDGATSSLRVEIEGAGDELAVPGGVLTVTDNSQGYETVWNNDTTGGRKRLLNFSITNGDATLKYLMMFASTTPVDGDTPIQVWPVAAGATLEKDFGKNGIIVQGEKPYGTQLNGCYFSVSTTVPTLTHDVTASWTWTINYFSF